jgi:hypothetical protein
MLPYIAGIATGFLISLLNLLVFGAITWGLGEICIAIIVVIALIAIVYAYCSWAGIAIPSIIVKCFWIVLGAVVCIIAIRFLLSM